MGDVTTIAAQMTRRSSGPTAVANSSRNHVEFYLQENLTSISGSEISNQKIEMTMDIGKGSIITGL